MGLDDFDSIPPSLRPIGPDDEDLFNFPSVDASGQPAPTPPAPTPPSAAPAPIAARAPIAIPAPEPVPSTPVVPPRAAPIPAPAPVTAEPSVAAPFPSAKPIARKSALRSVEVRHVPASTAPEEAAADEQELPPEPERARRVRVRRPRVAWLVSGVLVLNVVGFALLWWSNRSYRSGLEGLRDDLVVSMHDLRRAASDAAPSVRAADPSEREPVPSDATERTSSPTAPLSPHEETTLLLAQQEIDDGEHVQARKRLYRLLAVADRIDAELRPGIEARAMYLVGDSYRRQAEARREGRP